MRESRFQWLVYMNGLGPAVKNDRSELAGTRNLSRSNKGGDTNPTRLPSTSAAAVPLVSQEKTSEVSDSGEGETNP